MSSKQASLFESGRLQMDQSIDLTIASLNTYGPRFRHWAVAWSGGKDSTTLVTLVCYLIESGKVPRPETLTVCAGDLAAWEKFQGITDDYAYPPNTHRT